MVREFLRAIGCYLHTDEKAIRQAAALATIPVREQPAMKPGAQVEAEQKRQIPYRPRLTYAEEQAKWEWEHNRAAREALQRVKDGFF